MEGRGNLATAYRRWVGVFDGGATGDSRLNLISYPTGKKELAFRGILTPLSTFFTLDPPHSTSSYVVYWTHDCPSSLSTMAKQDAPLVLPDQTWRVRVSLGHWLLTNVVEQTPLERLLG